MALTAAPKFYKIESSAYPGYYITQQGTHVVLKAKDDLNPFQLWYKDESWEFLVKDNTGFVFINHGSKKALKSIASSCNIAKVALGAYDPAVEDHTLLWSVSCETCDDEVIITRAANATISLGHTTSSSSFKDGVPVVTSNSSERSWKLVTYQPSQSYRISCNWYVQYITWKQQNVDVTFQNAIAHNDETNVVAVHPNNNSLDGMIWYKVPAGGRDNTTYFSSFIVINKVTGFALKGSTKLGDKVLLTQYDPLDYDFVWSENRFQASTTDHVAINLDGTDLQWTLQNNDQYQNSAWYHPLTLRPASSNQAFVSQQAWKFNQVADN